MLDLRRVGGGDLGDPARHLDDLVDVGVGARRPRRLRTLEQRLAGRVEGAAAAAEEVGVAVAVGEQLLGERLLGREIAGEAVQPGRERIEGLELGQIRGRLAERLDLVDVDRLEQLLSGREVAVERADADARAARDLASIEPQRCLSDQGLSPVIFGRVDPAKLIFGRHLPPKWASRMPSSCKPDRSQGQGVTFGPTGSGTQPRK